MKRIALLTIIQFTTLFVSAQDLRKALEDLRHKYENTESVRIAMVINAYESKSAQRSFYHEKAIIEKHDQLYRYKLTTTEMIMNEKYIVVVDHSSQKIMLNKRDIKGEAEFQRRMNINMDSILRFYDDGKYEGNENGVLKYTITQKNNDIREIALFVNESSGQVDKLNYLYKTGQLVTIQFDKFDFEPTFDANEFDEKQFILKSGKTWQPVASLKRYQVTSVDKPGKF